MSYRYKTDDELEDFADKVVDRLRDFHITIREAKAFRSRRTEFRAADPAEGQPMTLSGYFVVFGQPYYIDDWCEEVVDRHAFDDADMTDVRALIDHDPRLCLGRHNDNVG